MLDAIYSILLTIVSLAQFFANPTDHVVLKGGASRAAAIAVNDFISRYCKGSSACLDRDRVAVSREAPVYKIAIFGGAMPPANGAQAREDALFSGPSVDYTISSTGRILERYVEQ